MVRVKQRPRPSKKSPTGENGKNTRKNLPTHVTKRRRHFKPGTVAVRQVRKVQLSTEKLLAKKAFVRMVRKAVEDSRFRGEARITSGAMDALQDYVENKMVDFLERVVSATIFKKLKTVQWDALEFVWTDYGTNSTKYLNGMVNMTHTRKKKKK